MMMTLVNALLQPNYILSNAIHLNAISINSYPRVNTEDDNLRTEIISFDTTLTKDAYEVNLPIQSNANVPNKRSIMKIWNNSVKIAKYSRSMKSMKKFGNKNSYTTLLYKQKITNRIGKQTNLYGNSKKNEFKCKEIIIINIYSAYKVYKNYLYIVLGHANYRLIENRDSNCISNMNIKHLKLFKVINNLNIYHLYVYLYKQLKITYNLVINIYINDIYRRYKIIKYNLHNMPRINEVTEIFIKISTDLYNAIALKIVDMTFNDNSWQRLEQLLNILCNTTNGYFNGFDIVWWNMQTCFTSFRKNPDGKWTKEFIVNCETIPEDEEEEMMVVYTIMDGKNVPINVEMKPKHILLDLISNI